MTAPWQDNWECFVDTVAESIRAGATLGELTDLFGDKQVKWNGVVEKKDLGELAPSVWISLPSREMDLGKGRIDTLDGITLPVPDVAVSEWNKLDVGSSVSFSATLASARSPFPPIEVKLLKDGGTIILIRMSNGVPV